MLYNILLIVQIVVSVAIIVLVLMQQGKGADAGAAFGSGASGTVFGARGSANFLSRATAILATVFFVNSIVLAFLASGTPTAPTSVMDGLPAAVTEPAKPAAPVANGDVPPVPGSTPSATGNTQSGDVPPVPGSKPEVKETAPVQPATPAAKETAPAQPAVQEQPKA